MNRNLEKIFMDAKEAKKDHGTATSIIRMSGRDINGSYNIVRGLMQIKGIGYNMARALAKGFTAKYGIDEKTEIGTLEDAQIANLEALIKEPEKVGVPKFMLNRRKDWTSGEDMHVIGTDLLVKTRSDIDTGIKIQTWVGSRHQYGQKVRGQRTRSTGRTGATIGVMKKSVMPAAAPGAATGPSSKATPGMGGKKEKKPEAAPAAAPAK